MSGKVTDLLEKNPKNAFKKEGLLYGESSGDNIWPSEDSGIRSVDRSKQKEGHDTTTSRQGQSLEEFTKAAEIGKHQIPQQKKSGQKLRSVCSLGNIEDMIGGHEEDFILKAARVFKKSSSMSNCEDFFTGFGLTLSPSEDEDLLMDSLGDGGTRSSLSGKSGHEELKSISKQILGTAGSSDLTRNGGLAIPAQQSALLPFPSFGLQAKQFKNAKPKRKVSFGNLPTFMTAGDDYYDRSNKSLVSSNANNDDVLLYKK